MYVGLLPTSVPKKTALFFRSSPERSEGMHSVTECIDGGMYKCLNTSGYGVLPVVDDCFSSATRPHLLSH